MRYKLIAVIGAVIISAGLCVNAQNVQSSQPAQAPLNVSNSQNAVSANTVQNNNTKNAPGFSDVLEHYYQSMRSCSPTIFKYDTLMMGVVNTNQVIGEQDGKCVIKEEINPEMVMVCKLPMRVVKKYANEHLKMLKNNTTSEFIQKNSYIDEIRKDAKYCTVQAKEQK